MQNMLRDVARFMVAMRVHFVGLIEAMRTGSQHITLPFMDPGLTGETGLTGGTGLTGIFTFLPLSACDKAVYPICGSIA